MDRDPEKIVRGQIPVHSIGDPEPKGYWDPATGFWVGDLPPVEQTKISWPHVLTAVIIAVTAMGTSYGILVMAKKWWPW